MSCLAEMYEKLGRMMGRSYEETVQLLSKSFKNMESQSRIETMQTFEKVSPTCLFTVSVETRKEPKGCFI